MYKFMGVVHFSFILRILILIVGLYHNRKQNVQHVMCRKYWNCVSLYYIKQQHFLDFQCLYTALVLRFNICWQKSMCIRCLVVVFLMLWYEWWWHWWAIKKGLNISIVSRLVVAPSNFTKQTWIHKTVGNCYQAILNPVGWRQLVCEGEGDITIISITQDYFHDLSIVSQGCAQGCTCSFHYYYRTRLCLHFLQSNVWVSFKTYIWQSWWSCMKL